MATTRLSDLYHAPGTSLQDQAAIALLWQANQGIFDALLAAGLVLLPAGVVALGMAMFAAPAFGRVFGGATVILGMASLAAAAAFVLDPHSPIVAAGYLALIAFNLVLGWRAYRVSKAPSMASASPARLGVTESAVRL
jgi:hypothetical protein